MNKEDLRLQPRTIIKCPHCGWEYLPGEVLYPRSVLGQPNNIIRDGLGHIIYEDYREGEEPEATEEYTCDNCNKPFVVEVSLNVKATEQVEELDFSEEYVSLL